MNYIEPRQMLETVTDIVGEIDRECCALYNGIENGLINVGREVRPRVLVELGTKLKDEQSIAWLLHKKLLAAGAHVHWELQYPGEAKRCDLVVHLGSGRLWLELKLASKAWFNCSGAPKYSNRSYMPYLQGNHHTHSFKHDFEKLESAQLPRGDLRAVCLIGFDSDRSPMGDEVAAVANCFCAWQPMIAKTWADRRCGSFRINVWSWLLDSALIVA